MGFGQAFMLVCAEVSLYVDYYEGVKCVWWDLCRCACVNIFVCGFVRVFRGV